MLFIFRILVRLVIRGELEIIYNFARIRTIKDAIKVFKKILLSKSGSGKKLFHLLTQVGKAYRDKIFEDQFSNIPEEVIKKYQDPNTTNEEKVKILDWMEQHEFDRARDPKKGENYEGSRVQFKQLNKLWSGPLDPYYNMYLAIFQPNSTMTTGIITILTIRGAGEYTWFTFPTEIWHNHAKQSADIDFRHYFWKWYWSSYAKDNSMLLTAHRHVHPFLKLAKKKLLRPVLRIQKQINPIYQIKQRIKLPISRRLRYNRSVYKKWTKSHS